MTELHINMVNQRKGFTNVLLMSFDHWKNVLYARICRKIVLGYINIISRDCQRIHNQLHNKYGNKSTYISVAPISDEQNYSQHRYVIA